MTDRNTNGAPFQSLTRKPRERSGSYTARQQSEFRNWIYQTAPVVRLGRDAQIRFAEMLIDPPPETKAWQKAQKNFCRLVRSN